MPNDNYLEELARVLRSLELPPGSLTHVFVAHDDWCAFWRSARCNCNPELRISRDTRN